MAYLKPKALLVWIPWMMVDLAWSAGPYRYAWSTAMPVGSEGWSECTAVAVDKDGSCVVGGRFTDRLFMGPSGIPAYGQEDVFLARLGPDGTVRWIGSLGGPGQDQLGGIAIDNEGRIYCAGSFRNRMDGDLGPGDLVILGQGMLDGYIGRFGPDGGCQWVMSLGGKSSQVIISDLAIDNTGDLYVAGSFSGNVDFDPGPGIDLRSARGYISSFVTSLDPNGLYRWTQVIGGPLYTKGLTVAARAGAEIYIGGIYNSPADFDPGPGEDYRPFHGDWDIFVTRLTGNGSYVWTRNLSGAGYDLICDTAIGPSEDLMVAGGFSLLVDMDPSDAEDCKYSDHQCVGAGFTSRWAQDGGYLWTWTMPDQQYQQAAVAVAPGKDGTAYTLYEQVRTGGPQPHSDILLRLLDPDGRLLAEYRWDSIAYAAVEWQDPFWLFWPARWAIVSGPDGQILIAGRISGCVDMDPGQGLRYSCSNGVSEGFVLKMTQGPGN